MEKINTALVSAFARAYHTQHAVQPVFEDHAARELFLPEEYENIAAAFAAGRSFFCPDYAGKDPLGRIVNGELAPTPLGRAAYAREALHRAVNEGIRQYVLFGAGYDTFAWQRPEWAKTLRITELDLQTMQQDKIMRLARAGYDTSCVRFVAADLTKEDWAEKLKQEGAERSFVSLLGLAYYLPCQTFGALLRRAGDVFPAGSELVLDYPAAEQTGDVMRRQSLLARQAGEEMLGGFSRESMHGLLRAAGFDLCEELEPEEITQRFFARCNAAKPDWELHACAGVYFCRAVKK